MSPTQHRLLVTLLGEKIERVTCLALGGCLSLPSTVLFGFPMFTKSQERGIETKISRDGELKGNKRAK